MSDIGIDLPSAAAVVVVRPGDTLIVRMRANVSAEQARQIRAHVATRLPGIDVMVICAEQLAVYRPDEVIA